MYFYRCNIFRPQCVIFRVKSLRTQKRDVFNYVVVIETSIITVYYDTRCYV
jgi:hypothetical protein